MNLLAVDSATHTCSVALMQQGKITAEFGTDLDQTHARHLMRLIDAVLALAGQQVSELDALAVTSGPGSFTGLRIGMATVKGFAMAYGRPVCPVSCLEALAWPYLGVSGLFCAMLDARKKQVYAQVFCLEQGRLEEIMPAQVAGPDMVIDEISALGRQSCWFAGSGAVLYNERIISRLSGSARLAPGVQNRIRAAVVAEMAGEMLRSGAVIDAAGVVPHYIRQSDAERKKKFRGK